MKVKPNLFLNMSPQTTEEGGLAFARNMKLDDDGNFTSDYGYKDIDVMSPYNIVGHVVGLDNKIYFFTATKDEDQTTHIITWSDEIIVEYDEIENTIVELKTTWKYNGGEIDGYVNTNQSGEKILTVGEYIEGGSEIPLKHINLSYCSSMDDESIYTQAPKVPMMNLVLTNTYVKTIPNGTYVFFVRYKIRKDVYTNWFLCSRPIFSGTRDKITTLQGGLSYVNIHKDSSKSFILNVNFVDINDNKRLYKEFQLGFIITHDESTNARIWKSFTMNTSTIYFDYENVEEINIDDLLESTYELYNVRNVTSFKNKLYIGNYIESDFNPDLDTLKNCINLSVAHSSSSSNVNYKNMKYKNTDLDYNYNEGLFKYQNDAAIRGLISKDDFNYEVSNLAKESTTEVEDAVTFEIRWLNTKDPDIAFIYNIFNNLYAKGVFGEDFDYPYPSGEDRLFSDSSLAKLGLERAYPVSMAGYSGNTIWAYIIPTDGTSSTPPTSTVEEKAHPWYKLDLTFAYGSFKENEYGADYAKSGVSLFNKASYKKYESDGKYGWITRDVNFSDAARHGIEENIKSEIEGKSFFGKVYFEVTSGADVYKFQYYDRMDEKNYVGDYYYYPPSGDPIKSNDISVADRFDLANTETGNMSYTMKGKIEDYAFYLLQNCLVGFDDSGTPIIELSYASNIKVPVNSIAIKFKKFEFNVSFDDISVDEQNYFKKCKISLKTTNYTSICSLTVKPSVIKITDSLTNAQQASTLMPYSTYKAYAHFVDDKGIITNGVLLGTIPASGEVIKANSVDDIISLNYSCQNVPNSTKYKSFFISLVNIGDIVMEGFAYSKKDGYNIINCLEIDTLLYNINDNITVLVVAPNNIVSQISGATYYSSGSSYPTIAFGNCGFVAWTGNYNFDNTYRFYIKLSRDKQDEKTDSLIKASGYIPFANSAASALPDGFYGSYLCNVKKPSFELSYGCYVAGNDIYKTKRLTALSLEEFKNYIQMQNSVTYYVRSNYNLNYLSLTEDIADKIFSIGNASSGVKQVAKVINSAILSYIYELKSMYKDFANKYFRKHDTDYKTTFDNTIRVSRVLSDETFNNSVFKFYSEDYYNVPTDRGIIVNLFSIGNSIFIHTKGSFYKFDGNQTLVSNNTDVKLQESEPFQLGITQLFDSQYGYGGIENKDAGCITFDSYFFYDKASNHIFGYSGNDQLHLIDGNIYKLLTYYRPKYCRTLHDELNCRILFEFTSGRPEHNGIAYDTFTLSYNYKTKSFISLHDLSLVNAFASRHRAYSYKSDLLRLFDVENTYEHQEVINEGEENEETITVETQIDVTPLVASMNINKIFGNATTACIIEFGASIYEKQVTQFGISVVMFPTQNLIEVINSIRYISDILKPFIEGNNTTDVPPVRNFDLLAYPKVLFSDEDSKNPEVNPVVNFYIITDTCVSSIINTDVDDTARPDIGYEDQTNDKYYRKNGTATTPMTPSTLMDYKGFKYDRGFWTGNYFRNNINKNNIYKYSDETLRALGMDRNSFVYGRYFILNFDFKNDTPIKFEELFINTDKQ